VLSGGKNMEILTSVHKVNNSVLGVKFVAAKILFQHWKQTVIAGLRIRSPFVCSSYEIVHSCQQKSIGLKFS